MHTDSSSYVRPINLFIHSVEHNPELIETNLTALAEIQSGDNPYYGCDGKLGHEFIYPFTRALYALAQRALSVLSQTLVTTYSRENTNLIEFTQLVHRRFTAETTFNSEQSSKKRDLLKRAYEGLENLKKTYDAEHKANNLEIVENARKDIKATMELIEANTTSKLQTDCWRFLISKVQSLAQENSKFMPENLYEQLCGHIEYEDIDIFLKELSPNSRLSNHDRFVK